MGVYDEFPRARDGKGRSVGRFVEVNQLRRLLEVFSRSQETMLLGFGAAAQREFVV